MELLDIVNENDEVIGQASRQQVHDQGLSRRIVHIFAFDSNGNVILNLRGKQVSWLPLHWVSSAAGHVLAGESYEQAAKRELQEEMGIDATPTLQGAYKYYKHNDTPPTLLFFNVFHTLHDGPFRGDPQEVDKLERFSFEQIIDMIKRGEKFHHELLFLLKEHFKLDV